MLLMVGLITVELQSITGFTRQDEEDKSEAIV